ncbi:MAG: ATP-binding protein [Patescibacteria group bacterium]
MDFINVILATVFSVNFVLATLIFINRKNSGGSIYFSLAAYCTTIWVLSMFFFRKIDSLETLIIPTKLLYISGILISTFFLRFSYSFLSKNSYRVFFIPITVPTLLLIVSIIFSPLTINSVNHITSEEKNVVFGPIYPIYGLLMFVYFLWSYLNFYKRYKVENRENKYRLSFIIIGTGLSVFSGLIFDIVFPYFGNFDLYWLGPMLTIIFVTFTAYAILRHKLFNVKVIAAELLTFSLWITISIRAFLSKTPEDQLINGGLLLITVVLGIFLIKSVIKEVESREEIERLAKDLSTANARLKELDKLKSEFVSIASHQLRSPLTAIKGYASLILDGSYGKITYGVHEAINKIFQSSMSLVVMVEDFLNISRIEQGTMKYNMETADIEKLIKIVVEEQEATAQRAGLKISFSTDKKNPYFVSIDVNKIRQVITNLIDNSVKYTPKGSISVRLYKEPARNKIIFSISDTGVGIDKETIPQLFSKFGRAKDANKINVAGAGLGLYVVKEIINGHKGRVWVTSDGKGSGSQFFVEFDENLEAARINRVNEFAKNV